MRKGSDYQTVRLDSPELADLEGAGWQRALREVFVNGETMIDEPFATIRERVGSSALESGDAKKAVSLGV